MGRKAQKIFYSLAIFALLSALFVLRPPAASEVFNHSAAKEVVVLKHEIQEHLRVAFWQTVGDEPLFESFEIVWRGIEGFYSRSAEEMLALIEPTPAEDEMNKLFVAMGQSLIKPLARITNYEIRASEERRIAGLLEESKFMMEEPLANIVPEGSIKYEELSINENEKKPGEVAGATFPNIYYLPLNTNLKPVNGPNEWVTIQDNYTGKLFCLAIYNNEINRYAGACRTDAAY